MINIATDCTTPGPSDWKKMSWENLLKFATYGNREQKESLTDWGYSGLTAWQFEELYYICHGKEWHQ